MDWTKIYKKYKGLWVALADNETTVLGFGKTLKEAISVAQKKKNNSPIVMRVPENMGTYVGSL